MFINREFFFVVFYEMNFTAFFKFLEPQQKQTFDILTQNCTVHYVARRVEKNDSIVVCGAPFLPIENSYAKKRSHGKFPGTCHKQLEPINLFSDLANKPWWPYLWTSFFCFVFAISPFDGSVS